MNYLFDSNVEQKIDAKFYIIGPNGQIPTGLEKILNRHKVSSKFSLDTASINTFTSENYDEILVTTGKSKDKFSRRDNYRTAIDKIANICNTEKYENIAFSFNGLDICEKGALKFLAEMIQFNVYRYNQYKEDKSTLSLQNIYFVDEIYNDSYMTQIEKGIRIGNSVNETRYLVDEPANFMYPKVLAEKTKEYGQKYGYEVDVKGQKEIEELGMGAFLGVAQGSDKEPQLIILRYNGDKDSQDKLGLVGKGITYDSGGLSIKPTNGMETMKCDMAGGATVIGAMNAIASAKLKINVVAVIAACENMISGNSYKPGDILKTMAGKHIYIGNTDAEGRLTLVDALYYIVTKEKVNQVIDLATLTGAALVALGTTCSASITNQQIFLDELQESFINSGEYNWQLPAFDYYKEHIKHTEADYTNTSTGPARSAGTILAGLLLGEFVEGKDWIHLDIAGPAFMDAKTGYYKAGATGYGVKTLYDFAENRATKDCTENSCGCSIQ